MKVRFYIHTSLVLILVADFQNQGAYQLAKEKDPEGKRTIGTQYFLSLPLPTSIGVLTKPDRIPKGDEDRWLALIKNEDQPLKNNWYCVKQPGSTALKNGISWKQAREEENEFFLTDAHFSKLDPLYQKYLRTGNLVERLSGILSDLIAKRCGPLFVVPFCLHNHQASRNQTRNRCLYS